MGLNIQHNSLFTGAFAPFQKSLSNLRSSVERLSSGEKYPSATHGVGQLGVANRMRQKIDGTNALMESMTNAKGYIQTRESVLNQTKSLINHMSELAYAASDPLKNTSDRTILNQEFRKLEDEIRSFDSFKYNGISVFDDAAITLKLGIESDDTHEVASLSFAALTFAALSIDSAANAATAITTLETRATSLSSMLANVGSDARLIQANMEISKEYVGALGGAEAAIKYIDVAQEVAEFTAQQLAVNSAQGILAQSYALHSNAVGRLLG
jgi:flagellin